jgi:hypothetical protein
MAPRQAHDLPEKQQIKIAKGRVTANKDAPRNRGKRAPRTKSSRVLQVVFVAIGLFLGWSA